MPTAPTAPTAVPEFPALSNRVNYNTLAFNWAAHMRVTYPSEMLALATATYTNAQEATTAAGIATDKAAIATDKAGEAAASAGVASGAAGTATSKLADIEALYDQFDDRYLGSKIADPALDNDGNALVDGAFYINSVSGYLRAYTVAGGWVQGVAAVAGVSSINGQTGAVTIQTSFPGSTIYLATNFGAL